MHRSYSQLTQWLTCPESYRLGRVVGVPQLQAAWFAQGLGVHAAAEAAAWGTDPMAAYDTAFDAAITESLRVDPAQDSWLTGTPSRGGVEDTTRRKALGRTQAADLASQGALDGLWHLPTGEPAAEVEFAIQLGRVEVRGSIDAIVDTGSGLIVRDYKTGTRIPGSPMQLGLYAVAADKLYGTNIKAGDYWMCKSGTSTTIYDLTRYGEQFFVDQFESLERAIENNIFPAAPEESKCRFCTVRPYCPVQGWLPPAQTGGDHIASRRDDATLTPAETQGS